MDNLDERVALLEGRITEQSMRIDDVREAVASLETRIDQRFDQLEQRFASIDQRFATIDQRFAGIDQRFITIDQRFVGLDGRLDQMNKLLWGVLVMVATGAVATVAGIVVALVQK